MAGFRQTDGSSGCPPNETPPADYTIPFRFDDAGRLWVTSCFKGFRYFGSARHDISSVEILGSSKVPVNTTGDISSGGVTAGVYKTLTVTNTTTCNLGILLANDVYADLETGVFNQVRWVISERWNGANHASSAFSTPIFSTVLTGTVRQQMTASANPHDVGFENTGNPSLTLAPGVSATVGCVMFLQYQIGAPNGTEKLHSANSAVRVYGYVI